MGRSNQDLLEWYEKQQNSADDKSIPIESRPAPVESGDRNGGGVVGRSNRDLWEWYEKQHKPSSDNGASAAGQKSPTVAARPQPPPPEETVKTTGAFWGVKLFSRFKKKDPEIITCRQDPIPEFETGIKFEYRYQIPENGCAADGYQYYNDMERRVDGKELTFASYKLCVDDFSAQFDDLQIELDKSGKSLVICGTAKAVGHLKIDLAYKHREPKKQDIVYRLSVLYVKPHFEPIPTDPNAPFQVEATCSKTLEIDKKCRIIGCSIRGESHERCGEFRDDRFDFIYDGKKHIGAVVVSDGAGSAEFSRKGAEIICTTFCDITARSIEKGDFDVLSDQNSNNAFDVCKKTFIDIVLKTQKALEDFAGESKINYRKLYATMLAYIFAERENDIALISFAVGDGAMVAINAEDAVDLAEFDHGEFQNETCFLDKKLVSDESNLTRRFKFFEFSSPCTVLAMTDGVFNSWFADGEADADGWRKQEQLVAERCKGDAAEDNLQSELRKSDLSEDDRTIVILQEGNDRHE